MTGGLENLETKYIGMREMGRKGEGEGVGNVE